MNINPETLSVENVYSPELGTRVTVVFDHDDGSQGVYPLRVEYMENKLKDGEKVEILVAEDGLMIRTKARSLLLQAGNNYTGGISFYGIDEVLNKLIVTSTKKTVPYQDNLFKDDVVQELRSTALQLNVAAQS